MVNKLRASLLVVISLLIVPLALSQTPAPPAAKPTAPGLIQLTGEDEKRAKQLDEQIDKAMKDDRWDEAVARAEELLALRTKTLGPRHFETVDAEWRFKALRRVAPMPKDDRAAYQSASAVQKQAYILVGQGEYGRAQPLLENLLEVRRRLLTDDHPDTTVSYNDVAYILKAQGKYAQAQSLFEKALATRRRLLGDDHPDTALSYNNLAANLESLGKYAQAQPLYEKALAIRLRLLGDDHPDTALSYNNLAYNLESLGKYTQAQPLYEKALAIRRRLLGDEHPVTAGSYNNVAYNLNSQGKYATAQPLHEKALVICCCLLGNDHPDTAISYSSLAANLNAQGKYAQAQPLYEKALATRRSLLGEDHPDTAQSYNNVAYNLNAQRKYAQAQPLYEKALAVRRRLLTDEHPASATSYNNLAANLNAQGNYAQADPLYEKALAIRRRLLSDDHPNTAQSQNNLAANQTAQGKYAQAQLLYEKALATRRRLLGDDHPDTALSYNNLAANQSAQGKYREARDCWLAAVQGQEAARLLAAFTGLERAGIHRSARPSLAAVLARLGQPGEAWQHLEADLGRGLLDELAARQDRRLAPEDRDRLRELTGNLERLERLAETTPRDLKEAERARRFDELKRKRELASIALGEFHAKMVKDHGPLAGQAATLKEIQAALSADAALVAWVDRAPAGPSAAEPDGEHWGVVVRSRGNPAWVPIAGAGPKGLWSKDDTELARRVRTELRNWSGSGSAVLQSLLKRLRSQRLEPLAETLAAADGLPPARRLVVLPSPALAGIPIEALFASDDTRTVIYAPSATIFKYLREQPRPDRHAGLLALGDPAFERPDKSSQPKSPPDHGVLVNLVAPGSNAAAHDFKPGDVLLDYNGTALHQRDDLKSVPEPGRPVAVELWREGLIISRELAAGKLGVVLDSRPAPQAIAEQRKLHQILVAARSGDENLAPLPGTRYEVEALAQLFQSVDRPTRTLLATDASEPQLERLAASGELAKFGFIHLATHGVIDEEIPARSAVILTQSGLPDPLEQALNHKPVFDGQLSVREIQHDWDLKAELVTLSACETALGRQAGGEGFVGFTQALLMSGARSVCLSLWKVDDKATSLLMTRFYQNMLGKRTRLSKPMPKAEALQEAKQWLRDLTADQVDGELAALERGDVRPLAREKGAPARKEAPASKSSSIKPYEHPHFWAAFVLVGDPD
jgi:tetratricopeptide (TPR) repeat protein